MTRWISFFIIILFFVLPARSQDLFSYENSLNFANYLFESGQYSLAAEEYERVIFLYPRDSVSMGKLLESYRMQSRPDLGLSRAGQLIKNRKDLPFPLFSQLYYLELENHNPEKAEELIQLQSRLSPDAENMANLGLLVMADQWKDAKKYFDTHPHPDHYGYQSLGKVLTEYQKTNDKNPYLAATMSTIIPGAGKAYSGRWADGAIALLFIGTNAWQSYRGFEKDGIKSIRGWVFGAIGAGFWIGNIYGSYKTAHQYNANIRKNYHDKASNIIYNAF